MPHFVFLFKVTKIIFCCCSRTYKALFVELLRYFTVTITERIYQTYIPQKVTSGRNIGFKWLGKYWMRA